MCCPGAPRRGGPARDIFDQKTLQTSGKTSESGKSGFAANPMGPRGAPSAPRGHKSSPRAHVGNPWGNKGELRFRVVPLCRVRGGISGEGFPDSNEFAAKFFANHSFSHVLRDLYRDEDPASMGVHLVDGGPSPHRFSKIKTGINSYFPWD